MVLALTLFAAWLFGALFMGRVAVTRGWLVLPTVAVASGLILLLAAAAQLLPAVTPLLQQADLWATDDPYHDTYYIVGKGPYLAMLGLIFLILAAIAKWIAAKGGPRTRLFLGVSLAAFHLSVGAQIAILFGAMPYLFGEDTDFRTLDPLLAFIRALNLLLAFMSQVSFLALLGVLVCALLIALRLILQRLH